MDARRIAALLGLLLAGGVLAGCTGAATNSSSTAGGSGLGRAVEAPAAAGGPAKADSPPAPKEQPVNQPGVDRKLIRTATLEMTSPDVIKVANSARDVAVGLGGFAGQEDVRNDAATITLQVPSNQFDEALRRLSDLVTPENLRSRATTAEDVTEQLVDLDSRIATQRTSVARVRALMDKAQTVNEVVQVESEVTRREADLESLEKRREVLSGQVALSKITVKVGKGGQAPPPPPRDDSGILGGLAGGWHAFLTAGGVVLRVIAAMLPFLIVFGIPGWFALRWWLRRRRPAPVPAVETGP